MTIFPKDYNTKESTYIHQVITTNEAVSEVQFCYSAGTAEFSIPNPGRRPYARHFNVLPKGGRKSNEGNSILLYILR
jgi:hypothetical protein